MCKTAQSLWGICKNKKRKLQSKRPYMKKMSNEVYDGWTLDGRGGFQGHCTSAADGNCQRPMVTVIPNMEGHASMGMFTCTS